MKRPKTICLAIGLALVGLVGCTGTEHNTPEGSGQGYTASDSIALVRLADDSLLWAFDGQDTLAMARITADMLRSPFARNRLPVLMDVLGERHWVMSLRPFAHSYQEELDSMLADAKSRKDTVMMFALLNQTGLVIMSRERDLAKALGYSEEAFRLDPRQVLIEQVPDLYSKMAQAYDNVKQWDRALLYAGRMVSHGSRTGDTAMTCWGHVFMAAEFQQAGVPDSIDPHMKKALDLLSHLGRNPGSPSAYALLAGIERQRGRHAAAKPVLDSLSAAITRLGSTMGDHPLGAMEFAWHDLHTGHPESARAIAETMRHAPGFRTDKFTQQCYHQVMDSIHLALGDHRSAYEHRAAYTAIRDSMNLTSAATNLQRIENNYKEDAANALRRLEDEAAANLLQKERARRNILFAAGLVAMVFGAFSYRQRRRTQRALKRSDELLLNILPEEVAEELKSKGHADARHFDQVTILFTDFKGFTEASEKLSPQELVEELNTCFKAFDNIITARGIEKIKTIGDAYMCAGGLPVPASSTPAGVVHAALEMQAFMIARKKERDAQGKPAFEMRVGIHTGPVVAGIVGVKKFAYDIWGDTVNTASRMESSGEVGKVNISESTYALVKDTILAEAGIASPEASGPRVDPTSDSDGHGRPGTHVFSFTPRGKIQAKGKGEMEMYFVRRSSERAKENFVANA